MVGKRGEVYSPNHHTITLAQAETNSAQPRILPFRGPFG